MAVSWPGAAPLEAARPPPSSSAIGAFTETPSVPSATRIFVRVPSSTASTSMVALSVSISAITSPDFTASPSCFSHLASLPSVIVGDSAGIRIWTPISARSLDEDIGPELFLVGFRAGLGEIGGLLDDRLHLVVDLLQVGLGRPLLQQHLARSL